MSQQSQHEDNVRVYRSEDGYTAHGAGARDEDYAYTPQLSGNDLDERFRPHEEWRQKASATQSGPGQMLSPGQRLALAIVSVSVLVPLVGVLIASNVSSENASDPLLIGSRLLGLFLVCLTIMVVNVVFNRSR